MAAPGFPMRELSYSSGNPLAPTPAELRARQNVRPALHRATGQISFRPLKDDLSRSQPANLRAFLLLHGIPSVVVEEVPTMPEIQLQGIPDLDRVQALLDAWQDGADGRAAV